MASSDVHSNGAAAQSQADQPWQLDHPYCVPTPKETSEAKWEGSCHCGQIRYFLSRDEPLNSKYCHCSDCQTMHAVSNHLLLINPHPLSTHGYPNVSLRLPFNGPRLYTNLTSASPTVPMASPSTLPLCSNLSTTCLAKSIVQPVIRRFWTRGGIWSCCSRS